MKIWTKGNLEKIKFRKMENWKNGKKKFRKTGIW